ncbi:ras guanine nucleotide exchange factor domain-containing protein [Chytriomyces cf. hyalinus JEL632]|nr:ras guanine nucleotide exchange factor domain-containing protein [Chytriomyces cf. hyalinus JEL632]
MFSAAVLAMRSKYSTPQRFLDALLDLYDEFDAGDTAQVVHPVQLRVCSLLSIWLMSSFDSDFKNNPTMLFSLQLLLEECSKKSPLLDSFCDRIRALGSNRDSYISNQFQRRPTSPSSRIANRSSTSSLSDPIRSKSKTWCERFLMIETKEIVEQLNCLESDIFCAIKTEDLLLHVNVAKRKNASIGDTSTVDNSIGHFNFISAWVVTRILMGKKPKARAKMITKFVEIAMELWHQHNFNTLMAVISGLRSTPIDRLKQTTLLFPDSVKEDLEKLEQLMSSERQFARYRAALHEADLPCIPYLGVTCKDLIYIEEGVQDYLPDGSVNFSKLLMMGDIILTVQQLQSKPHNDPRDEDILSFILESTVLSEEQAFDLSLQLEPRQPQPSSSASS